MQGTNRDGTGDRCGCAGRQGLQHRTLNAHSQNLLLRGPGQWDEMGAAPERGASALQLEDPYIT